eukprot:4473595-Lingulodinium_polyedra.AAC.1
MSEVGQSTAPARRKSTGGCPGFSHYKLFCSRGTSWSPCSMSGPSFVCGVARAFPREPIDAVVSSSMRPRPLRSLL